MNTVMADKATVIPVPVVVLWAMCAVLTPVKGHADAIQTMSMIQPSQLSRNAGMMATLSA